MADTTEGATILPDEINIVSPAEALVQVEENTTKQDSLHFRWFGHRRKPEGKFSQKVIERAAEDIDVDVDVLESARNPNTGDIDPYEDMIKSADGSSAVDALKKQDSAGKNFPDLLPPLDPQKRTQEIVEEKYGQLIGSDRFSSGHKIFLENPTPSDESWALFEVSHALEAIPDSPDDETKIRQEKLHIIKDYLEVQNKNRLERHVREAEYRPEDEDKPLENMTMLNEADNQLVSDMVDLLAHQDEVYDPYEKDSPLREQYTEICTEAIKGDETAIRFLNEKFDSPKTYGTGEVSSYEEDGENISVSQRVTEFYKRIEQTNQYFKDLAIQNEYHDLADNLKLIGLPKQQQDMLSYMIHYASKPTDTELVVASETLDRIDQSILENPQAKAVYDQVKYKLRQKMKTDLPTENQRTEQSLKDDQAKTNFDSLTQEVNTEAQHQLETEIADRKAENLQRHANYIGETIRDVLATHRLDTTTHSPTEMLQRVMSEVEHSDPVVHAILEQVSFYPEALMPLFAKVVVEEQDTIKQSQVIELPDELSDFEEAFIDLVKSIPLTDKNSKGEVKDVTSRAADYLNTLRNKSKSLHPELHQQLVEIYKDEDKKLALRGIIVPLKLDVNAQVEKQSSLNLPEGLTEKQSEITDLLKKISYDKSSMSPQDLLTQVYELASADEALHSALQNELADPEKAKDLASTLEKLKSQQEWDDLIEGDDGVDMETVLAGMEDVSKIQELISKVSEKAKAYGDEGLQNMQQLAEVVSEAITEFGPDIAKKVGKAALILLIIAAVLAIGGVVIGSSMMGGGR